VSRPRPSTPQCIRARPKTPAYQGTALRDQQLAQFLMGKARARVEASRDTIHRAAEFAYENVEQSGALLSPEAKIRLQLAVWFAAEAGADAVRLVNHVVGPRRSASDSPSSATSATRTPCCSMPTNRARATRRPAV
jgi:alkylation response protein AidB-like acyl-CoA dehydrogenase